MKSKLTQLVSFVSRINPNFLKFGYFALMLAGYFYIQSPSDGGTGPF